MIDNLESAPDILVVDDEPQIRAVLRHMLEAEGFTVREAETGRIALGEVAIRRPDLILLDLGLPDRSGEEVLNALRSLCVSPVLVLTVREQEETKVAVLDAGADDYLTKPFGGRELLARVRALLRRRRNPTSHGPVHLGSVEVDLAMRLVRCHGRPVTLTVTEFALLQTLVVNLGRVVTHRELLRQVWGPKSENRTHYLRMYMMRLRRKLSHELAGGDLIRTEAGVGYRLVSPT